MSRWIVVLFLFLLVSVIATPRLCAQADYKRYYDEDNLPKVRLVFQAGRYDFVLQICDYALQRGQPSWEWRVLRFESLANLGRYEEAFAEASKTADLFPESLGAQLRIYEFFQTTGRKEEAAKTFAAINRTAAAVPKNERTSLDLVYLGEAALVLGADPAKVLEMYISPAKAKKAKGESVPPGLVEAHLFAGHLALKKDDLERAANEFREALKYSPDDPEALFGLARALLPSDREGGLKFLEDTLIQAPVHFGALLLHAEYAIHFERYDAASEYLSQVEAVNPQHPEAHAYRAILAEIERHDDAAFQKEREAALSVWRDNPEVDYLIGRVLSKKYRFAEGAESQKRALAFDPGFLPAKLQLALDYLKLGQVEAAWPLAKEVAEADEYNVLALNLETLEKEIASFTKLETDDFLIRLPVEDAEIYGARVVEILTEAKRVLGEKYGLTSQEKTLVEFYPDQQDFAIRTFGELGGEGLLGVCSGTVVTMNSPGSKTARRSNWEATLWHEYCHVITLTATKNKMPRWLSEGISVYEELQRNPAWGQRMTPRYRRMILEEEALTPIREMSEAFFQAKSGEDVMFAYYQSMLLVDYFVKEYGLDAVRAILKDLGEGVLINVALERHTASLDALQKGFALSTIRLAEAYGPGVDWTSPKPEELDRRSATAMAAYLQEHPSNFEVRQALSGALVERKQWDAAIESADALINLLPEYSESGNGYLIKALAFRGKKDTESERAVLEKLSVLSAEALSAYNRLIELNFDRSNWDGVIANAHRGIAINPFNERLHYCRGCAHEAKQETAPAVESFENALLLDPGNPSELRFRLARLHRSDDPVKAKRFLLDSLADSPRYQEAHALLVELVDGSKPELRNPVSPDPIGVAPVSGSEIKKESSNKVP